MRGRTPRPAFTPKPAPSAPPLTNRWGSRLSFTARNRPKGAVLALGARLELRQGQGLVITPQLQQAIKLLQLTNLELEAFVEAELERNPLLARDDAEPEPEADARA